MKSNNFVCEEVVSQYCLRYKNIIAIKTKFFLLQVLEEEGEMIEKSGKLGFDKVWIL
jgi:hypothetical protein